MGPDKRRNLQPGLIEEFIEDSSRETMKINLYPREIRRLKNEFPEIEITQDSRIQNTSLWNCTVSRR